jgi:hypothetical protein
MEQTLQEAGSRGIRKYDMIRPNDFSEIDPRPGSDQRIFSRGCITQAKEVF